MSEELRNAVAQARSDEKAGAIIGFDMMAFGAAAWAYSGSWIWGLAAAGITGFAFNLKGVSDVLAAVMSVGWAVLIYFAATDFGASPLSGAVLAVVLGIAFWGMHLQGLRHLRSQRLNAASGGS